MIEALLLVTSYAAGVLLGGLFFGGLWWTIHKAVSSSNPAAWFLVSLLLRMAITLTGFFAISGGHWQRMLVCLFGFLTSRQLVTWLTQPAASARCGSIKEIGNAH